MYGRSNTSLPPHPGVEPGHPSPHSSSSTTCQPSLPGMRSPPPLRKEALSRVRDAVNATCRRHGPPSETVPEALWGQLCPDPPTGVVRCSLTLKQCVRWCLVLWASVSQLLGGKGLRHTQKLAASQQARAQTLGTERVPRGRGACLSPSSRAPSPSLETPENAAQHCWVTLNDPKPPGPV